MGFNVDFGYNGASGNPNSLNPGFGAGSEPFAVTGTGDTNTWYGAALYASYKVNKVITLSARGEYLHSDSTDDPRFGAFRTNVDDFSETLTASFAIWDNLLTRAEYRYDHVVNGTVFNNNGNTSTSGSATYADQNEVSIEAVYSF